MYKYLDFLGLIKDPRIKKLFNKNTEAE